MMRPLVLIAVLAMAARAGAEDAPSPDYASRVAPVLKQYCAGCHNDADREGDFSLESYASLQAGGPHGPVLKAGDGEGSLVIRQLTGRAKLMMPPKGEPRPGEAEVALLKAWIDSGARGPSDAAPTDRLALMVPKIAAREDLRAPVTGLASSADGKWLATARYESVELRRLRADGSVDEGQASRVLRDFPGKVTAVHFTADGSRLVTASGVVGLGGLAAIWKVEDGALVRRFEGHRDLLYDAELSPDGKTLATCGYDRTIQLWDAASGEPSRTLVGHNGAVYDVAFSPDGAFLVSASADDTCKVWRVADGLRLDTLPQPLKEELACAFSPDGRFLVAGGGDHSIRVWEFVSRTEPRINPMILARFAHEGSITRLAFTADGSRLVTAAEDRTIKVWETTGWTELRLWEHESDVVTSLAVSAEGGSFRVGRMDGSVETYPLPAVGDRSQGTAEAARVVEGPGSAVAEMAHLAEREPNDGLDQAMDVVAPAEVSGAIAGRPAGVADVDLVRFAAKAGDEWVIEVEAARTGSKLDSFVEVLDSQGRRIERARLQATRDSYFTFRGKDDSTSRDLRLFKQDEIHLDEYLYANGEVSRFWHYPRGPDSGFLMYPGLGARWGYFDTTPLAHALGEPCYVVEAHPPGAVLVPNGLPVFPIYFENDDDSHRELGKDSRLFFTVPTDGSYLVKLRDVRGGEGPESKYKLVIRPRRPDFRVSVSEVKTPVGPGGAQEFKVSSQRMDGFDGPIRVEVGGLPAGFSATSPLMIQTGQIEAMGVVIAQADAAKPVPDPSKPITVTATATIRGAEVTHPVNSLGALTLADKPPLRLKIGPAEDGPKPVRATPEGLEEYEIHPGQTITLKVSLERNGNAGAISLGLEDAGRNLPYGVYVDNIGLNGLLVTEVQQERTFFVTADRSVAPQVREFHLSTASGGGQSSLPVLLRVR